LPSGNQKRVTIGFCRIRQSSTDLSPVPSDKSAIQSVTPSQIYAWEGPGPDVDLTGYAEARMPSEQKWYVLTGRVVDLKVEAASSGSSPREKGANIGFREKVETDSVIMKKTKKATATKFLSRAR
jgi:hypothetical protein